jgi:hypothetical protein
MPNYGLYKLDNSNAIPRFMGSALPELTKASEVMQGRYDQTLQYEDALDTGIEQATSLNADTKMLQSLKDTYRAKLKERAGKGDYENMLREVSRDARDFVNQYKPIAQNQAAVSQYRKELDDQVAKGDVSKDWADTLFRASTDEYSGLARDSRGQITNQFRGVDAVKQIDLPKWVENALVGLEDKVTGSTIRKDEGGFYVERSGKREYLGKERIDPIIAAAKASDPLYRSYVKQKALVDSYGAKRVSEEAVREQSPELYKRIAGIVQAKGISFGEAAQQYMQADSEARTDQAVNTFAYKHLKDNRTSEYKVMGETEATGRAYKALEDKEDNTFMGIIQTNLPGTTLTSGKEINGAIDNFGKGANEVLAATNKFIRDNGVTVDRDSGKHFDRNGRDVSHVIRKNEDIAKQLRDQRQDVRDRDKRAREQSGYTGTPSTAIAKEAQAQFDQTYNTPMMAPGNVPESEASRLSRAKAAYENHLEQDPAYKKYSQILKDDAKNSSVAVGVQRFNSKKANDAMELMVTNLSQDLDIGGLKGGALGMRNMDGSPLNAEDYEDVRGDTKFAGWFIDPSDGQYKLVLKVGKVRENTKGEVAGKVRLVKMDAPPDVAAHLVKTGQVSEAEQYVAQNLGALEQSQNKVVSMPLMPGKDGTADVHVRRSQISEQGIMVPKYEVTYTMDGKQKVYHFDTPGEVQESINGTMINVNKPTKPKK